MRTGRLLILLLVVAVIVGGLVAWRSSRRDRRADRIVKLEAKLSDDSIVIRSEAATQLLDIAPNHAQARIVRAEVLLDAGDTGAVRSVVQPLLTDADDRVRARALQLRIRSFHAEAGAILRSTGSSSLDLAASRVRALSEHATFAQTTLAAIPGYEPEAQLLEAERMATLAQLARRLLTEEQRQLALVSSVEAGEMADTVGTQVLEIREDIDTYEGKVESLCRDMHEAHPDDARPLFTLVESFIRQRRLEEARKTIAAVVAMPRVDRAILGELAMTLLELDVRYAVPVTPGDVDLAAGLVNHPGASGRTALSYELAHGVLAIAQGRTDDALRIAGSITEAYPHVPRADVLQGEALIAAGDFEAAHQVLAHINDIAPSHLSRYRGAQALFKQGREPEGQDLLRQTLDADPAELPSRLALIESIERTGYVEEAAMDVEAALAANPDHPIVMHYFARVSMERGDARAIQDLLDEHCAHTSARWEDVYLAALMGIDDVDTVLCVTDKRLKADGHDRLAAVAAAWARTSEIRRDEVARLTLRRVEVHVTLAPMMQPDLPTVQIRPYDAGAPPAGKLDTVVLLRPRFVPSLADIAYGALSEALRRWPDQPTLADMQVRAALWALRPDLAYDAVARRREIDAPADPLVTAIGAYLDGDPAAASELVNTLPDEVTGELLRLLVALQQENREHVDRALARILNRHPLAQAAPVYIVADTAARGRPLTFGALLEKVREHSPQLSRVVQARTELAMGRPGDALQTAATIVAADVRARGSLYEVILDVMVQANLQHGAIEVAAGVLGNVAVSSEHARLPINAATIDVLAATGRRSHAIAIITTLIADPDLTDTWRDRLLARATVIMPPARVENLVNTMLQFRAEDPLLLAYLARSLAAQGRFEPARAALKSLGEYGDDAPRALMTRAYVEEAQGRLAHAVDAYHVLLEQGGWPAEAARRELQRLDAAPSTDAKAEADHVMEPAP